MAASGFVTKFGLHESSLPLARLKQHRVVARYALDREKSHQGSPESLPWTISGQCLSSAQAVARLLHDPQRKMMGGISNQSSTSFFTGLRKTADETLLMLTGRASTFPASRPD
ncbi:hypothetical protein LY76DRAFT_603042 [Colletotrichum caudatum]|nr:hypothetical protein LY76DRAFT_603042 [Colletotrichum caudatum]